MEPRDQARGDALAPTLATGSGEPRGGPPITVGSFLQHYEIIRPLGKGGMGAVFLSRDTRLGRLVAIKLLLEHSGESARRFLVEARATARISHENIVAIHELGQHGETPYMVLEYLKGKTLQQLLDERRASPRKDRSPGTETAATPGSTASLWAIQGEETPRRSTPARPSSGGSSWTLDGLAPERAVALMIPVVRALVCAHDAGIVHRDLKPSNILLTDDGVVKLLDFGIAQVLTAPDAAPPGGPAGDVYGAAGGQMGTAAYMSPEQWGEGPVDHRSDLWAAGVVLAELVLGRHPLEPSSMAAIAAIRHLDIPVPSLEERFPELGRLGSIIDRCLLKRYEDRTGSARELLAELEALVPAPRAPPGDVEQNPYAGLSPFREGDAPRFFGRTAAIAEVIAQLDEQPLLAIVGPSGAGKSSFVRAGVIPALGNTGDAWDALTLRPGPHPLLSLAEILLSSAVRTTGVDTGAPPETLAPATEDRHALVATLRAEPGLLGARLRARARRKLKRTLLFVDQLEELYTLAPEEDRAPFIACLAGVADDAGSPLRVVLTLRSDFLDRVAEARATVTALRRGLLLLPPMDRDGLREALVRPLEAVGHGFDPPGLVEEMLDAVERTRGALPILSFAAAKLWEQRDRERRRMTEASYRRIGGVAGTLAGHADGLLGAMSPEERRLARAVLVRLVTPERTRALCTMAELCDIAPASHEMRGVLARLIDARLLTVEGAGEADATVEIVHESLIASWPTLAAWVAENGEDAVFLAKLRNATREWDASERSEDLLWRGQAALDARRWRERYTGALTPAEEGYLSAVVALADRARTLRQRLVGSAFVVIAAIAVVVSYLAIRARAQAERAEAEAREARNATRMAAARELSRRDTTAALAILREIEPPGVPRGWDDLAQSALRSGLTRAVLHHSAQLRWAAWSPDGERVVTAAEDNAARVWSADGTGEPLVLRGHESWVMSAAFSPDGKRIVTASIDRTARVWNADGTGEPLVLRGHEREVRSAAWSPDGKRVVTASIDRTVRVWNADGSGEPLVLRGHELEVSSAAFSPDGRRIVTASWDKTARVWNADGTGEPLVLRGHQAEVYGAAWSPDGSRIATGSIDKTARVWSADAAGEPLVVRAHEGEVVSVAWSPDGKRIATATTDFTARLWNPDGTGEPMILRGHTHGVVSVAWSPDGKRVVTASPDNTARIWNVQRTGEPLVFRGHADDVMSVAWSPDGKRLVTTSTDTTARIWNADGTGQPLVLRAPECQLVLWYSPQASFSPDGKRVLALCDSNARVWNADGTGEPLVLRGRTAPTQEMRFTGKHPASWIGWSPDGDRVLSVFDDELRVWNTDGPGEPLVLRGHGSTVRSAAWSPDGKRIATAHEDTTARLWSADGTGEPLVLRGHDSTVRAVAWSPDGKRIATTSEDRTARLWSADGTGEPLVLRGHARVVFAATWSPDGNHVVTVSEDRTARVWNADGTGEPVILRGHDSPVLRAMWSPDGKRIVTASTDKTARVWNADGTGEPVVLRGHERGVNSAAWSPDGKSVVTASADWTARVWTDLEPLGGTEDPKLWTAIPECMSIERRIDLLGFSEATARTDQEACQRRVDQARAAALAPRP